MAPFLPASRAPGSYTTFNVTVSAPSAISHSAVAGQLASGVSSHLAQPLGTVTVTVTNTGAVNSDYVILVFAVPPTPGQNGAPLQCLVAFDRIYLPAGATQTVPFPIVSHALAFGSDAGKLATVAGQWQFVVEGTSASVVVA